MDVSIIIATNRPHENYLYKLIDSIKDCHNQQNYIYEIIVCSTNPSERNDFKLIKDNGFGPVKAFNICYKASIGKIICGLPDGVLVQKDYFNICEYVQNMTEKFQISGPTSNYGGACSLPGNGLAGNIIRFPVITRDTIETYLDGLFFNESFKYHMVDNWLGAFPYLNGQAVFENNQINIIDNPIRHDYVSKYDAYDVEIYKKLVAKKAAYGELV